MATRTNSVFSVNGRSLRFQAKQKHPANISTHETFTNHENLNIANYIDTDIASDIIIDEKNINLSLVPVYETMLFSGIPEPKIKPIPEL